MNVIDFAEDLITRARMKQRTSPSCAVSYKVEAAPGRFDAWSVMLDCFRHDDIEHWVMSIKLMTQSSTVREWRFLGEITEAVIYTTGYPKDAPRVDPIIPIQEAHPTATLWWAWHGDGSMIDESAASVFREVVSVMTPRDPQWKGT